MANGFAYFALMIWPLVVVALFRVLPRADALVWSIVGGYLALPYDVSFDVPAVASFDKSLIPALSALVMCVLVQADDKTERATFRSPTSKIVAPPSERPASTTQYARRSTASSPQPPISQAPLNGKPLQSQVVLRFLLAMLVLSPFLTLIQNTAPSQVGVRTLPGLTLYDTVSTVKGTLFMLLPFLLARRYLGAPAQQAILLRILCFAGLIYTLPTLFEIRMSPQLSRWTYGFLSQSFAQAMRDGGFRPVVFLQHGLWLAIFLAMAAVAAFGLCRQEGSRGRKSIRLLAGIWLTGVLLLSHSLGAFIVLCLLIPFLALVSVRGQLLVASLIAVVMLTYPLLRSAELVPLNAIYELAASISEDRAQSLQFRIDQEETLLAHANEKALAGWGGYGRSRVFDPRTGADISVTDSTWILLMGGSGWVGYLATFGLLAAPILLLFRRRKTLDIGAATVGLCMVLAANMIDMMLNATMTPVTWLVAGALAGRTTFSQAKFEITVPQVSGSGRLNYTRRAATSPSRPA